MTRIGIVTGLVREARIIARAAAALPPAARPVVFCAGADWSRARDGAHQMADQGVQGLVSFGLAGGLDPALAAGDLVIADRIVTDGGSLPTDRDWGQKLAARAGNCHRGVISSRGGAALTVADKASLRATDNAVAVDMESGGVAVAAADAGLPFLAVRVIIDARDQAIPSAAMSAMGDGTIKPWALLAGLLRSPRQIGDLARLGGADRAAMKRLGGVAALGLPAFFLG